MSAARADAPPSAWAAPAGELPCASRAEHLAAPRRRRPTRPGGRHDAVATLEVLPCQTAAAATVHVGNGARDTVFTDHLLLGRDESEDWRILCKVFAPRPWPEGG